jgi:transposase
MFYIGIDVSKAKLDCSLLMDATNNKRKSKVVINSKAGISDLLAWTNKQHVQNNELHAILEGTGVYHEQAAQALHDAGVLVSIVNPALKYAVLLLGLLFAIKPTIWIALFLRVMVH